MWEDCCSKSMCMQITWDAYYIVEACRFWASRLGNGDWDSAYLIVLITAEKSVFKRAVSVGSSAFCSLILCYFLTLRLSHMDLWLLHDHTTPGPLHCLSTQPKTFFFSTALFMAGFETKFSCQQLTYIWMTHFSIRWLSLTIVLKMGF